MTLMSVPIIDISPYRSGGAAGKQTVAREIDRACRDIGFLVITGHGVPGGLIKEIDEVSRAFFDLPLDEKMRVGQPAVDILRGYFPMEVESLAHSRGYKEAPGDLNESLLVGPPVDAGNSREDAYYGTPAGKKHFAPNLWPAQPAALQEVYVAYFHALANLAQTLMRLFALALEQPENFFDDKIDRPISRLRVRNYPAPSVVPKAGQLRVGTHTDWGSLTILKTEDKPGGLQVFNKAGAWVDVPIVADCFIINIGDLMARWTNDAWVSTLHRVVTPPMAQADLSRRQSLVYFDTPNYDAVIDCIPSCHGPGEPPKYPVTTPGEHLREMFLRSQG